VLEHVEKQDHIKPSRVESKFGAVLSDEGDVGCPRPIRQTLGTVELFDVGVNADDLGGAGAGDRDGKMSETAAEVEHPQARHLSEGAELFERPRAVGLAQVEGAVDVLLTVDQRNR
jgi:hypothetical protein